jgi:hypothetical protein
MISKEWSIREASWNKESRESSCVVSLHGIINKSIECLKQNKTTKQEFSHSSTYNLKKISEAKDKLVLLIIHVSQNMKDTTVHRCDLPSRRY